VDDSEFSRAVVEAIGHTAMPHVDDQRLLDIYGPGPGRQVAAEGVNDIMARFRTLHPGLTVDALREIGRCVGWNWR
jgi:hypothetical protein